MSWITRATKDRIFSAVLITIFGVLSMATVVSARSAQIAAQKGQALIERSNRNSPILDLIQDCTTPGGKCYDRNQAETGKAIALITAQQACVVKESLNYNLPDRSPAEISEIKNICSHLLGGDALDLLRRVNNSLSSTTTTTIVK